jgi:hypothetical protein
MKVVAIENLIVKTILTFCENAAELGCPRDREVDMWFRELSSEDQNQVASKMMEIEERYGQLEANQGIEGANEKNKDKIVKMVEIEFDLPEETIEGLIKIAKDTILNDRQALINYGANYCLSEIVETDGNCLKEVDP